MVMTNGVPLPSAAGTTCRTCSHEMPKVCGVRPNAMQGVLQLGEAYLFSPA